MCARYWLIVGCCALNHYKVPEMKDDVVAEIPKMTATFFTVDPNNFNFIGSFPEVMLARVPSDNDIIMAYRQILNSGVREVPTSLQTTLETVDMTKRGGKIKLQATGGVPKKTKQ